MKKVLILTLILALSLTLTAMAAFVSSPSGKQAPELISAENENGDCEAELVITHYSDRHTLDEATLQKLEEAYGQILDAEHLAELTDAIHDFAAEADLDSHNLDVSDLFDISRTDCDGHEYHGHFDIVLKPEFLHNFVCLLHYYNGAWRIVDDAEVTNGGTHLEFTEDEFSPFAIVVDTSVETPKTGDAARPVLYAAVMVVSLALIVLIVKKSKKKA